MSCSTETVVSPATVCSATWRHAAFSFGRSARPASVGLDDRGAPVGRRLTASHKPGGLELPDAQGDGRRLVAARGGELGLGTRSRRLEFEEQELLPGMDAERGSAAMAGSRCRSPMARIAWLSALAWSKFILGPPLQGPLADRYLGA